MTILVYILIALAVIAVLYLLARVGLFELIFNILGAVLSIVFGGSSGGSSGGGFGGGSSGGGGSSDDY